MVADFSGGAVTSDAGGLLVRGVAEGSRILEEFPAYFDDYRNPDQIEHSVVDSVSQRVYGIALEYEDVNDHEELRGDTLLATRVGKRDPTGADRIRERDLGSPLAGKSTLNRFELAPAGVESKH